MDVEQILQIISNVGFPIAVCLICFFAIYKLEMQHRDDIMKFHTEHMQESSEMRSTINNNTMVMQKLIDKIEIKIGSEEEG